MDSKKLVVGKKYKTVDKVEVCFYEGDDCLSTLPINLPLGTELTYIGPDAEDGYVFENGDHTRYWLHDDDLPAIEALI